MFVLFAFFNTNTHTLSIHILNKFVNITATPLITDIELIKESVSIIKESGIDHEFRTTTVRELHTKEDFAEIAEWIKGDSKYFLQQFVDSGNLIGNNLSAFDKEEMAAFAENIRTKTPNVAIRGI